MRLCNMENLYSRRSVPVRPFNVPLSFTENIRMENGGDCNGTVRRTNRYVKITVRLLYTGMKYLKSGMEFKKTWNGLKRKK